MLLLGKSCVSVFAICQEVSYGQLINLLQIEWISCYPNAIGIDPRSWRPIRIELKGNVGDLDETSFKLRILADSVLKSTKQIVTADLD